MFISGSVITPRGPLWGFPTRKITPQIFRTVLILQNYSAIGLRGTLVDGTTFVTPQCIFRSRARPKANMSTHLVNVARPPDELCTRRVHVNLFATLRGSSFYVPSRVQA